MSVKISAIMHVYNEARQIRECLESIKWVDEIVIMDCYSDDGTWEICRGYTNNIYQRRYANDSEAKNWLLARTTYEWILTVDADEIYTPEAHREIRRRLAQDSGIDGYFIKLCHVSFGRPMLQLSGIDMKIKLFRKSKGRWQEREVHGNLKVRGRTANLSSVIRHYNYINFRVFAGKFIRYSSLEAKEMLKHDLGLTPFSIIKVFWSPFTDFARMFFVRGIYRDGLPGFIVSVGYSLTKLASFAKYFYLRLRKNAQEFLAGIKNRFMGFSLRLIHPVYPAAAGGSAVYLTFDDGPHPRYTPLILDLLKKHKAMATFFLLGSKSRQYPELVKLIHDAGHGIGGHGYEHLDMRALSDEEFFGLLRETKAAINEAAAVTTSLFRPPAGKLNSGQVQLLRDNGYKLVMWTIDPRDFEQAKSISLMKHEIFSSLERDAIILLHHEEKCIRMLPDVIKGILSLGYELKIITAER